MNVRLVRVIAALGACAALLALGPAAAGAGLTHDSGVTTTIPVTTTTTTPSSLKSYREALLAYLGARREIAETFKAAVGSAHATYEAATASATTGAQRSTARAAYDLAIAQAAAARSAALISLGNPPVRPT